MAVKKGLIWGWFSREKARQLAIEYQDLPFVKKPKNIIGLLYVVVIVLSLATMWFSPLGGEINGLVLSWTDILLSIGIYAFLAIFIFLNHRWAMIVACLLYSLDKVVFFVSGGFLVSQIIFGFLCISLTWHAVLVAKALKNNKAAEISTFD